MPMIPVEIVDHILSFLAEDSATLGACSLVDRSWLSLTRPRIFRNVALMDPPRGQDAINFFEHSSHLASYVRRLAILFPLHTTHMPSYLELHQVFSNLEAVSLAVPRKRSWHDLPVVTLDSIRSILSSGMLRGLKLVWWFFSGRGDELADILRLCSTSLETLCLLNVTTSCTLRDVSQGPAFKVHLPNLRKLDIKQYGFLAPAGMYHLDTPKLTSLSWESAAYALHHLPNIVPTSSMSDLTSLALRLTFEENDSSLVFSGPTFLPGAWQLPNLRTLSIDAVYPTYQSTIPFVHILECVSKCVSQIPSSAALESVAITFPEEETFLDSSVWEQLESKLGALHRDGVLRTVTIRPPVPMSLLQTLRPLGIMNVDGVKGT